MKKYKLLPSLILLLSYCYSIELSSQNLMKKLPTQGRLTYLGSHKSKHVFKEGYNKIVFLDANDYSRIKELEVEEWSALSEINDVVRNGTLCTYTNLRKDFGKKNLHIGYTFYRIDAENEDYKEVLTYTYEDTSYLSLSITRDTLQGLFLISNKDSLVAAYTTNLEKVDVNKVKKVKYASSSLLNAATLMLLESIMKQLNFKFYIDIKSHNEKIKDEGSFLPFQISMWQKSSQTAKVAKEYFDSVKLTSYPGLAKGKYPDSNTNKLMMNFELEDNKQIHNIQFEKISSGLLVWGKCSHKINGKQYFEAFSCIFGEDLKYVKNQRFFELNSLDEEVNSIPDDMNMGLIMEDLGYPDFSFYHPGEKVFIHTYQHSYRNIQDHIYILKIYETGEIITNRISVRSDALYKKFDVDYSYSAALRGGSLLFFFYDSELNFENKANTRGPVYLFKHKGKTIRLMTLTYDIVSDSFSDKEYLGNPKDYPKFLSLKEAINIYNPNTKSWNVIQQYERKGKYSYYIFSLND